MLKGDELEPQSWLGCPITCVGQDAAPNSNLAGAINCFNPVFKPAHPHIYVCVAWVRSFISWKGRPFLDKWNKSCRCRQELKELGSQRLAAKRRVVQGKWLRQVLRQCGHNLRGRSERRSEPLIWNSLASGSSSSTDMLNNTCTPPRSRHWAMQSTGM